MPLPELEPTPRSLTNWGKGKPCCLFSQHCQKAHARRALRTTLTAGWSLRMQADRPLLGTKVAGWWILLSLCKYAPDLNLPASAAARKPTVNSLCCFLRSLLSLGRSAQSRLKHLKASPFLPKKSTAEVRGSDPLQLPEELKRGVCAFIADVWIYAILKTATLRDSKSPNDDLKAIRSSGISAGLLCLLLKRVSLLARQRCSWCPGVNAPRAAGGERSPGCSYCFAKVGTPWGPPFLHLHREVGDKIIGRGENIHIFIYLLFCSLEYGGDDWGKKGITAALDFSCAKKTDWKCSCCIKDQMCLP